jgi:RHS repeat-associated protein
VIPAVHKDLIGMLSQKLDTDLTRGVDVSYVARRALDAGCISLFGPWTVSRTKQGRPGVVVNWITSVRGRLNRLSALIVLGMLMTGSALGATLLSSNGSASGALAGGSPNVSLPASISVSVGYADNLRSPATFPSPWQGDSGVKFVGDAAGSTFDSGAVMVSNSSSSPVTLGSVTVQLEGQTWNLWGSNLTVPANGELILAQVGGINAFDTSDANDESCVPSTARGFVHLTYSGQDFDFEDPGQVLNTNGIDGATCNPDDEGHAWVTAEQRFGLTPSELNGTSNPITPDVPNVDAGEPINVATGNFTINKTDLSLPGLGRSLTATRSYNSIESAVNGPLGYGWSAGYQDSLTIDSAQGYVTLTEGNGATGIWDQTSSGLTPAQPGITATLVQNPDSTYTLTLPSQTVETFSATGVLQSETDPHGYTTSLTHNTAGQLTGVTDPEGRTFTYSWSGSHITGISDGQGRSIAYGYDSNGNLASFTDVDGNQTTYGYDSSHHLTSITDPDANTLTNTYNAAGQAIQQTDADGNVTQFAYGSGESTVTLPDGSQTQYQFSSDLVPTSITRGYGSPYAATTTYGYDAQDAITSITQPDGETQQLTYDSNGNLLTSTNAAGNMTTFTYNNDNEPTSVTDAAGIKTTYSYNATADLTGSSTPIGDSRNRVESISYVSGMPGVISTFTDPDGHVTTFGHNKYGEITSTTDPEGNQSTSAYNSIGQVIASVEPRGYLSGANPATYTTTYKYTPAGLLTQTTDPDGHVTSYAYNGDGQPVSETDPKNQKTSFAYDPAGLLTKTTLPGGITHSSSYTPMGLVSSQTDGANDTTRYTYNALELLATKTTPGGEQTSFTYNGDGQLTSKLDPESQTTTYSYDTTGDLIAEKFSNSTTTPNESFGYDADGRMTSMTDGTGTSTFGYDNLGDLLSQSTPQTSGSAASVNYSYDPAGNLTDITYPTGLLNLTNTAGAPVLGNGTVQRTYNADNQLASVTDWLGNKTSFSYDPDGNLASTAYPSGVTDSRAYDPAGLLTQITDTDSNGNALLSLPYQYDADGNVTQTGLDTGTVPSTSQGYGHDSLGQVTSSTATAIGQPVQTSTYSYDNAQRLITGTLGLINAGLSYNADGELQKLTNTTLGQTVDTYSHDPDGDRTSATNPLTNTTSTYQWNQLGELTGYRGPGVNLVNGQTGQNIRTATYSYDALGLRSDLTWDLAEGTAQTIGTSTAAYIDGPDGLPIEQISPANTVLYYLHDELGSTRLLTNQSGKIVAHYAYDAYGNQITSKATGAVALLNPFMYAGQYSDPTNGLIYMRARYYDPASGQFISQDPEAPVTHTPYTYASNDPIDLKDPTGLDDAPLGLEGAKLFSTYCDANPDNCPNAPGLSSLVNGVLNGIHDAGPFGEIAAIAGCLSEVVGPGLCLAATGIAFGANAGSAAVTGHFNLAATLLDALAAVPGVQVAGLEYLAADAVAEEAGGEIDAKFLANVVSSYLGVLGGVGADALDHACGG